MNPVKRYSTTTGKEITPAQDFADGYAAAVADVVAWLTEHAPVFSAPDKLAGMIERGDARGAAGKAGGK